MTFRSPRKSATNRPNSAAQKAGSDLISAYRGLRQAFIQGYTMPPFGLVELFTADSTLSEETTDSGFTIPDRPMVTDKQLRGVVKPSRPSVVINCPLSIG